MLWVTDPRGRLYYNSDPKTQEESTMPSVNPLLLLLLREKQNKTNKKRTRRGESHSPNPSSGSVPFSSSLLQLGCWPCSLPPGNPGSWPSRRSISELLCCSWAEATHQLNNEIDGIYSQLFYLRSKCIPLLRWEKAITALPSHFSFSFPSIVFQIQAKQLQENTESHHIPVLSDGLFCLGVSQQCCCKARLPSPQGQGSKCGISPAAFRRKGQRLSARQGFSFWPLKIQTNPSILKQLLWSCYFHKKPKAGAVPGPSEVKNQEPER